MVNATRIKPRSPFGDMLRDALEETGVSIKGLSRLLADEPEHAEAKRRLLQKYVGGEVSPGGEARNAIADALGVPRERFHEDKELEARRRRILTALIPLADELLELATEAREQASK